MWLVGVVIRRYIDILIIIINFPYSTCIRSFFGRSILTSLFIFKMFFLSYILHTSKIFECNISFIFRQIVWLGKAHKCMNDSIHDMKIYIEAQGLYMTLSNSTNLGRHLQAQAGVNYIENMYF